MTSDGEFQLPSDAEAGRLPGSVRRAGATPCSRSRHAPIQPMLFANRARSPRIATRRSLAGIATERSRFRNRGGGNHSTDGIPRNRRWRVAIGGRLAWPSATLAGLRFRIERSESPSPGRLIHKPRPRRPLPADRHRSCPIFSVESQSTRVRRPVPNRCARLFGPREPTRRFSLHDLIPTRPLRTGRKWFENRELRPKTSDNMNL